MNIQDPRPLLTYQIFADLLTIVDGKPRDEIQEYAQNALDDIESQQLNDGLGREERLYGRRCRDWTDPTFNQSFGSSIGKIGAIIGGILAILGVMSLVHQIYSWRDEEKVNRELARLNEQYRLIVNDQCLWKDRLFDEEKKGLDNYGLGNFYEKDYHMTEAFDFAKELVLNRFSLILNSASNRASIIKQHPQLAQLEQNDPTWLKVFSLASAVLGVFGWAISSRSIKFIGFSCCAVASLAMLLKHYGVNYYYEWRIKEIVDAAYRQASVKNSELSRSCVERPYTRLQRFQ